MMLPTKKIFILKLTSNLVSHVFRNTLQIRSPGCIVTRNIYLTSCGLQKSIFPYGAQYAHEIMKFFVYKDLTPSIQPVDNQGIINEEKFKSILKQDFSLHTPQQLVKVFEVMSNYCSVYDICIAENMFDSFIDTFTDSITHLSDQELKKVFINLSKWPETGSIKTRNFIEVWAALDDACFSRLTLWDTKTSLLFADYIYLINVGKSSDFIHKCIRKLTYKAKQLTDQQVVQTFFYITMAESSPPHMHSLIIQLEECYDSLSLDELSIVASGLLKTKTPIRNKTFLASIVKKIIDESDTVKDRTLNSLFNIIKYSTRYPKSDVVEQLLNSMAIQIERFNINTAVNLVLIAISTNTYNHQCFSNLLRKTCNEISDIHLKLLERVTCCLCTFDLDHEKIEEFYMLLITELRSVSRVNEIERDGKSFVSCLSYLAYKNEFPLDLFHRALDPSFVRKSYGKNVLNYGRELLIVDKVFDIYCPSYKGNRLCDKISDIIAKNSTDYVPEEGRKTRWSVTQQTMLDIVTLLQKSRGGTDYVCGDHILPHYQRGDIIVCNDKNNKPMPVLEHFPSKHFGTVIGVPDLTNKWYALVIVGRESFARNSDKVMTSVTSKLHQLSTLGYRPILVSVNDWKDLAGPDEQLEYINKLMLANCD